MALTGCTYRAHHWHNYRENVLTKGGLQTWVGDFNENRINEKYVENKETLVFPLRPVSLSFRNIGREILSLLRVRFNPLKTKLVCILLKNSVPTSKRTPNFTITKINWLMLFKEIIAVYSENHIKPINAKFSINDCQNRGLYSYRLALKG
jgi:hypothetical protein